jgi:hypothetical protein
MHGPFVMAPNQWDPASHTLVRPLRLASDRSVCLIAVHGAAVLSPLDQDHILVSMQMDQIRIESVDDGAVGKATLF